MPDPKTPPCPTCGMPAGRSIEPHLTAALTTALKHVPPEIRQKLERYLERVCDEKLIEMAYEIEAKPGNKMHPDPKARRTTKSAMFRPKKVERGCSLGHIAVNRIFETFDVSGTPDKNRVLDVVNELIEHVRKSHHVR